MKKLVDKILAIVINIQDELGDVKRRVVRLEDGQERIIGQMDGIVGVTDRHEAKIAALGSAQDRTNKRLTILESN